MIRTPSLCLLATLALQSAAAPGAHGTPAEARDDEAAPRVFVFVCDDRSRYVAEVFPDHAWVFPPGKGALRLRRRPATAGRDYGAAGFQLLIEDQHARIRDGATVRRCRNDRRAAVWEAAKLAGADFRAVGNEPGWVLTLYGARLILELDYGRRRLETVLPPPLTVPGTVTTRWRTSALTLELTPGPCRDDMRGEVFETRVTLRLPGRTLHGCGRALH